MTMFKATLGDFATSSDTFKFPFSESNAFDAVARAGCVRATVSH